MNQQITVSSSILTLLSICCLVSTNAQVSEMKLVPGDGEAGDFFGNSVSISGSNAIIGEALDDDNGSSAGAAYIFHFDGSNWIEQAKLTASDGSGIDRFGQSVSISGDYAIVGAHYDISVGPFAGSAYIFHYDGSNWVEQIKLVASDASYDDQFGVSVSISGNYVLVGAYLDDVHHMNDGSAYVFYNNGVTWVEQAKLTKNDNSSQFGSSVSLSGDYALVGARLDGGRAYIFHREGPEWPQQATLVASDGSPTDHFGSSVSLNGGFAIVGAPQEPFGVERGSAYVFRYDGSNWVEQSRLMPDHVAVNELFGYSVSLSGNYAIVGARWDEDTFGSAYIFHFDGSNWVEETKLIASDGSNYDEFGISASLSSDYALVGSTADGGSGLNSGSVYVYSATPLCSKVSQFQARCRPGGLIKARVTMADASHAGDIVEISIDDVPYEVTIDATGRGQLSQAGFSSGPHTVELTNPGQCFDPIVVTCRTSLDEEASDDWDDDLVSEASAETALRGNYPNPFNPSTTIRYTLSNDGPVSIRVYNMLGQEVATLVDGFQKAGEQSATWHGTNNFGQPVASGLYIYRLQTGSTVISQKMLFAK